jgi:TonB family protein
MKNKSLLTYFAITALLCSTVCISPEASAQTSASAEQVYSYVEQMPAFEGGDTELMNFLASNMQYPQDARAAGVEGLVVLSMIIETNGSITSIDTVKGLSESTDAEAKRLAALTAGKWSIGRHRGKAIRVKYTLPVRFSLAADGSPAVLHKMPQFKGGQEAMVRTLYAQLEMPAAARKENVNARVDVKFTIEKDGSVSNVAIAGTKLKRSVGAGADMDYMDASTFKLQDMSVLAQLTEAATGAIKRTSGMWESGLQGGKPVVAEVSLPVLLSGAGKPDIRQQLETMQLTYQPDAYDKKTIYKENEVDVSAALKDGPVYKFLAENLRYPEGSDFTGRIKIFYIVQLDGSIIGPITSREEEQKEVAAEIKRVFKLAEGKWVPAQKNTQPVAASQEITVEFVTETGKQKATAPGTAPADVVVVKNK